MCIAGTSGLDAQRQRFVSRLYRSGEVLEAPMLCGLHIRQEYLTPLRTFSFLTAIRVAYASRKEQR
jgi:hypothetical protein